MSVVISPATTTRPVVSSVSQATRLLGSPARTASSTVSEIWSAILSGCPSVTDSDVKVKERRAMLAPRLAAADGQEGGERQLLFASLGVAREGPQIGQALRPLHARDCEQR